MDNGLIYSVSDFVAYLNQTLEMAYPYVTIEGELSNFRVAKNRWVYFDLKDEQAVVRCFGTVYVLPGPLEDGMVVRVSGSPRLHPQYSFSITVQAVLPVGQGSIKRASDLLQAKLAAEGLFDVERKRPLPYPPKHLALITAGSSAAYADFMKITNVRWRGLTIDHYDVLVQGEQAPAQIVQAIARVNAMAEPPDVLVLVRGGGSAEDLSAFSSEVVTRAVATSRVPTLVAIGHEIDTCLAELAADQRASTPSNAAELLLPDRTYALADLREFRTELDRLLVQLVARRKEQVMRMKRDLQELIGRAYLRADDRLESAKRLLVAYDPTLALQRGYALVHAGDTLVRKADQLRTGMSVRLTLAGGTAEANITKVTKE